MNYVATIDRRSFVIGTAAAGAGFSLGMSLPFSDASANERWIDIYWLFQVALAWAYSGAGPVGTAD